MSIRSSSLVLFLAACGAPMRGAPDPAPPVDDSPAPATTSSTDDWQAQLDAQRRADDDARQRADEQAREEELQREIDETAARQAADAAAIANQPDVPLPTVADPP